MKELPATSLLSNLGTWAVMNHHLPAVAASLLRQLPEEEYDPEFQGQKLETIYFDTANFDLRKARKAGDKYLTLRLRCYDTGIAETYAISAKTESEKFRVDVPTEDAEAIEHGEYDNWPLKYLPASFAARYMELVGNAPLLAVVKVCCHRYAVESSDGTARATLDVHVQTDTGLCLPCNVLEWKAQDASTSLAVPEVVGELELRPIKLSKFLWATGDRR